jgi:hypothetical protein
MTIRQVAPAEVLSDWSYYEAHLSRVIAKTDAELWPDDILTCIQRGAMQMWRALEGDAIGVTELQTFPRYKQLLLYAVAGEDASEWLTGADHDLEAFALSHGCTRMEFHGRPGWQKSCRAFGYTTTLVCMKKRIGSDGRRQPADAED